MTRCASAAAADDDALAHGSYLALAHLVSGLGHGQAEARRRYNERVAIPQRLPSRAEVAPFFTGLDLVPPVVVYVRIWRPDPGSFVPPGVARKPPDTTSTPPDPSQAERSDGSGTSSSIGGKAQRP